MTIVTSTAHPVDRGGRPEWEAVRESVVVDRLVVEAGGARLLDGVSLAVARGELFAIAGPSGAGKSTLVEAIAGIRPVAGGAVRIGRPAEPSASLGFVPQDDIVHRELPLVRSLRYAARLRLPAGACRADVDDAVARVLRELRLDEVADVRVGDLSGGQRKRASIAMELLTHPSVLLLDEPTSGLDPATAADVMDALRSVAEAGTTVVVTTHHLDELERVDRFAFLGTGGRVAFVGTAAQARATLGLSDLTALYTGGLGPQPRAGGRARVDDDRSIGSRPAHRSRRPGAVARWWVLTRRSVVLLGVNRLTLAILFGSPAMVIAMMVVLFPPAGTPDTWTDSATIQLPFWTAFAAFFFGLTAGLLQIVPEAAIAARERRAGVGSTIYVLSKVAALAPALIGVSIGLLVALAAFDRLPTAAGWAPVSLVVTVLLLAASALALGLLASALVRDSSQAALALPMLCFPQVLFAGAVVAVGDMAPVGRVVSNAMSTRWGFEGTAENLGIGAGGSPIGVWVVLAGITVGLLVATIQAVRLGD